MRKALREALNPVSGDSVLRPEAGPVFPRILRMVFSFQGTWRKRRQGDLKDSLFHG